MLRYVHILYVYIWNLGARVNLQRGTLLRITSSHIAAKHTIRQHGVGLHMCQLLMVWRCVCVCVCSGDGQLQRN